MTTSSNAIKAPWLINGGEARGGYQPRGPEIDDVVTAPERPSDATDSAHPSPPTRGASPEAQPAREAAGAS